MNATVTPQPKMPATAWTLSEFVREYAGANVEVVDGIVKELGMPQPRHGRICTKAARFLDEFVEPNQLGIVCANDTFVLIQESPLRVRGADVVYWSREKVPGGVPESGVITAPPDLCVEVVSPSNTWTEVFTKVGEYLGAGVTAVVVLDADTATASVYRTPDSAQQILKREETLTLPDVLPGFAVSVSRFFE